MAVAGFGWGPVMALASVMVLVGALAYGGFYLAGRRAARRVLARFETVLDRIDRVSRSDARPLAAPAVALDRPLGDPAPEAAPVPRRRARS